MRFKFATLDVFSRRRFAGNPLAIVLDADDLDSSMMISVAREFNAPETVFVMRPAEPTSHARLRIFTVTGELPFAGHPTIGAAVFLSHISASPLPQSLRLEETAGVIPCTVSGIDGASGRAQIRVPRPPQESGAPAPRDEIAAALQIEPQALGFDAFAPACWSSGIPFTFVPLSSRDALARCRVDLGRWDAAFTHDGSRAAFVFCRQGERTFAARMFAPRLGIPEDPATGSAVAAFAGVLSGSGQLKEPREQFIIHQGEEMGRPSSIELSVMSTLGNIEEVTIAGDAVLVSEGWIET